MSIWKIAWRNITQRGLASALTVISMAFGYAVMIVVLVLHSVVSDQFSKDGQGYNMIVGAKGGALQLVFNTVFHLDKPIENIPYAMYEDCLTGRYKDFVETAVPMCLGDSFQIEGRKYRVVATRAEMFDELAYGQNADSTKMTFAFLEGGRNFKNDHFNESVIGNLVARQTGLKVGDVIVPTHGISTSDDKHDESSFKIVGILERTGTATDRAVFINMEGFYLLTHHSLDTRGAKLRNQQMESDRAAASTSKGKRVERSEAQEPSEDDVPVDAITGRKGIAKELREVTAILVLTRASIYSNQLYEEINAGVIAQAVFQTQTITIFLQNIVWPMQLVLLILTLLIVIVTSLNIAVGIYNSMQQRRRDIAIMRALGASRFRILGVILCEASLLSLMAGVLGYVLGHGLIAIAGPSIETWAGIRLIPFKPAWIEFRLLELGSYRIDFADLLGIPFLTAVAAIVGLFPAITAYRTDVSEGLSQ